MVNSICGPYGNLSMRIYAHVSLCGNFNSRTVEASIVKLAGSIIHHNLTLIFAR